MFKHTVEFQRTKQPVEMFRSSDRFLVPPPNSPDEPHGPSSTAFRFWTFSCLIESEPIGLGILFHESHEPIPISGAAHDVFGFDLRRLSVDKLGLYVHRLDGPFVVDHVESSDVSQFTGGFEDSGFVEHEGGGSRRAVSRPREFHVRHRFLVQPANELQRRSHHPRGRHVTSHASTQGRRTACKCAAARCRDACGAHRRTRHFFDLSAPLLASSCAPLLGDRGSFLTTRTFRSSPQVDEADQARGKGIPPSVNGERGGSISHGQVGRCTTGHCRHTSRGTLKERKTKPCALFRMVDEAIDARSHSACVNGQNAGMRWELGYAWTRACHADD